MLDQINAAPTLELLRIPPSNRKALGIDPPEDVAATLQERAWSSPIWYTPEPELVKDKPEHYYGLQPLLP